jgi:hypothetical protein
MIFTAPMPYDQAVSRLQAKTPVASALSSADWAAMPLALRDRAFFTAQVAQIKTVAALQAKLEDSLSLRSFTSGEGFVDRSKFIADLRKTLAAAPGDSGELTDLTSSRRLGLIFDFQTEDAQSYGRYKADQDPDLLNQYPAQELVRIESREEERDWSTRWAEVGGTFYGSRMIALKTDPLWQKLSRFGRPWPPFDFGSGMGLEDIDRDEALELGLIKPSERLASSVTAFNDSLQASVPQASPALLEGFKQIFGDQVDVARDGTLTWQGQRILKLYEQALSDPQVNWSLSLGKATPTAATLAPELKNAELILRADDLRHIHKRHIQQEADGSQRPLTPLDLQLIPHVWRTPDAIVLGNMPGTLEMQADIAGWHTLVTFDRGLFAGAAPASRWGVSSFWAKRKGVQP